MEKRRTEGVSPKLGSFFLSISSNSCLRFRFSRMQILSKTYHSDFAKRMLVLRLQMDITLFCKTVILCSLKLYSL